MTDATVEELRSLHTALELPRAIEERMLRLIRQNRISKWFSGYGQEAISVGCTWALRPDDTILPLHRNAGVWTTRGVPLERLFRQLMGKAGGYTGGRDRTFHFGLPEKHIVGMISHLGAMLPVACGIALAARLRGDSSITLAFCGDGATREGDFHEALSLAALWKLPTIFVIENNGYGLSTAVDDAVPVADIADAASGYGMPGEIVDGNDVIEVISAVRNAADRARQGAGPSLLEMKTFRIRGHEEASGTWYVPEELTAAWKKQDPLDRFVRTVVEAGARTEDDVRRVRQELAASVKAATEAALNAPAPESTAAKEHAAVYAPAYVIASPPSGERTTRRYVDAIKDALCQAMEADKKVLVMGQDIAHYGGVFKVTEGLSDLFGCDRVRDTPIIESAALGAAMGLALEGFRPVVELQYADFVACGFNQIVNNLATTHYRWGAGLAVTIRAPYGGYIGAGPFHSQCKEAWFCHVPGLKVVAPATPHDAKGLLLASIADPNPVLFFEHKRLYRSVRADIPANPYYTPLGEARVVREGGDASIITYGLGVSWALEEAEWQESQNGVRLEVVDLRSLVPWDRDAVLASIARTSRLLVLHEATLTCGFGAEVVAWAAAEGFHLLDAPPVRVAAADLPVPAAITLEHNVFAAKGKLRAAIESMMSY